MEQNSQPDAPEALRWYYAQNERVIGPMPFAALQALWKAGELPPDTLVAAEGTEAWKPLSDVLWAPSSDAQSNLPTSVGKNRDTKSAKGCGVLIAGFEGIGRAGCIFVVGLLLSLTGIGAIVGIPLMLVAVCLVFVAPLFGLSTRTGPCPYCGADVIHMTINPGIDCPACKKRIVIRDKKLVRVD